MAEVPAAEIETSVPGVTLRCLRPEDAPAFHDLLVRNRDRLTRCGDWVISDDLSVADVLADIEQPPHDKVAYGILEGRFLVGQISVTPAKPPHWSIGYFLDGSATGRGIATAACRALEDEARRRGAIDLYGVVTNGNEKSCAVLSRAGYVNIQEHGGSTRWWLPLADDPEPPIMA